MAIPHEKGTRETKQRPNAWDGVFSEVQGSSSLGHIPDPAPEVGTETQKQARGAGTKTWGCQPFWRDSAAGSAALGEPRQSHFWWWFTHPAQLHPWVSLPVAHTYSQRSYRGRGCTETPRDLREDTLRIAKFEPGIFLLHLLALFRPNHIFSGSEEILKNHNSTAHCCQAGKKSNFLQFSYSEKTWSFKDETL